MTVSELTITEQEWDHEVNNMQFQESANSVLNKN